MSIVLIIVGLLVASFGARIFRNAQSGGEQSTLGGLLTLLIQLGGWALVIWGAIRLFN